MAKVIIYSRYFPKWHPRAGEKTRFVEKFWQSIRPVCSSFTHQNGLDDDTISYYFNIEESDPGKGHTIRAGYHWKVGDIFSPRVWSGEPYKSKQIIIGPNTEIKKLWNFELRYIKGQLYGYINNQLITIGEGMKLAKNDGLLVKDLTAWFNKPFTGQIICWNEKIMYYDKFGNCIN